MNASDLTSHLLYRHSYLAMADPLSVTGGAVGIVSLGLTVCQGLLQYYASWKDCENDVAAMCGPLDGLARTLQLLETSIRDNDFKPEIVARLEESIKSCRDGVGCLQKKLNKVKAVKLPAGSGSWEKLQSHYRRALYPFKESTLAKLRETVSELRDNLILAVGTLQM